MPEISVAICTRGRQRPLLDAVRAVAADLLASGREAEILVVDDGDLPSPFVRELVAAAGGLAFSHVEKHGVEPGLYGSRKLAVRMAGGDIVLFLDDDAEVGAGYCDAMMGWFDADPAIVGVGGVDSAGLPLGLSRPGAAFARVFLLVGKGPGDLSPSGLNHGQASWRLQREPFRSDYLHGCNMAFRRNALSDLPAHPWLAGHSPFEDIVLSRVASARGGLVVDPRMPLRHLAEPGGRGEGRARITSRLTAHWEFATLYVGPSLAVLLWSTLGLMAKDMAMGALRRSPFRPFDVLMAYARFAAGRIRPSGVPGHGRAPA